MPQVKFSQISDEDMARSLLATFAINTIIQIRMNLRK